jgi:BRCA1-associated protein
MSQLDSQREWYEERAEAMQHELAEMKAIVERAERARLEDDTRRAEVARGTKEGEDERANLAERGRARAQKRTEKLTELARRLEKELREERAVSEGLMKNMSKLKQRTDDAEAARVRAVEQVRELEDNLRDVMFALELQSKIAAGGEVAEVAGGSVEVPAPIPTPSKGKKARNKK